MTLFLNAPDVPAVSGALDACAALPLMAQTLLRAVADRSARVAVLGLGYVGTPLATHLGEAGFRVTGYDVDAARVATLNAGRSPVQDVSDARVRELVGSGHLSATADPHFLAGHDVYVLCVPTPLDRHKQPDMRFIASAASAVADALAPGALVILESTTYPGTTEDYLVPALSRAAQEGGAVLTEGESLFVAFSPERVDPGNRDFQTGNIPKVIGGASPLSTILATAFYRSFLPSVHPVSSARVAELSKLHENTFRSVNIAMVNELAIICSRLGVDVWEVVEAAATKPFGFMPFWPGPGVGGHCIPLDPHYLAWMVRQTGLTPRFVTLADEINSSMPAYVASRVQSLLNDASRAVRGSRVLVLGVSYKRDVDDSRESPSLDVIHELQKLGAEVSWFDPWVAELPERHGETLVSSRLPQLGAELLSGFDVAVVATDHSAFDWDALLPHLRCVLDTRGRLPRAAQVTRL